MEEPPASNIPQAVEKPEVNQPGLAELREAVANFAEERLPTRATVRKDAVAGLSISVAAVPDAMATGILAGVNPLYGLYAAMAGPLIGGLFTSTQLMVITTTSASALAAGAALNAFPTFDRSNSMFLLTLLVGIFCIILGALRAGRLTRFVSYSVMTGFLTGISVILILSQIGTVVGHETEGANNLVRAYYALTYVSHINAWALGTAVLALLMAFFLPKTFMGHFGTFAAIVVPSVLVFILNIEQVQTVSDVGSIAGGFPWPDVPSFAGALDLVTGAIAVALIILVQGAGVSQSVPNPDGRPSSASTDFVATGLANVVSGFFRGIPVGGSVGETALGVISGAHSRWASIFAGLWMALVVIVFPGIVSYTAMPALGAILIVAGIRGIKPQDIEAVFDTGWESWVVAATTFLATLLAPIQAAVGLGVVLSALIYIIRSASDISVVELVRREDGLIEERKPCKELPSNDVTVLDLYGPLFFATARSLEHLLPSPRGSENAAVVLRLRGQDDLGATMMEVLSSYARKLKESGGRLYLSGLNKGALVRLAESDKLNVHGPVQGYEVTSILGQSTRLAIADAEAWLVEKVKAKPSKE